MDDNGGRSDGAAEVTCSLSNAVDSVCPSRYAKLVLFDCASPKTQISSLPCLSVEQEQFFFLRVWYTRTVVTRVFLINAVGLSCRSNSAKLVL